VQSMAFSKMTNKMPALRLVFSQNLLKFSHVFGAKGQSLILNFTPQFGEKKKHSNTYQIA
jgi:hypothetical protein